MARIPTSLRRRPINCPRPLSGRRPSAGLGLGLHAVSSHHHARGDAGRVRLRFRIVRPLLPDFIHQLEVRHLRVGHAEAHLNFERGPSGQVAVHVLPIDGQLEVAVEEFEHER